MLQSETDSLATLKPELLTNYFENMSGSIQYAEEYNNLKNSLEEIN